MRLCIVIISYLISVSYLLAQPLRFQRYTIHDGLSQSSVKNILQDKTGFIWLATQDGLNRFDGKNFKVWKRDNGSTSLSGNNISQLLQHGNGKLWIGIQGGGITVYNTNADSITWIRHAGETSNSLVDDNVSSLVSTSFNEIWVGSDRGISVVNPSTYAVSFHLNDFDILPVTVTHMAEDTDQNIWVATRHDGVYIFNGQTKKEIGHISKADLGLAPNRVDPVRHVLCDKKGRVWVSTNRGLFLSDSTAPLTHLKKITLRTTAQDFTNEVIMCTMFDHNGKLWIGTQNGLLIERNGSYDHYTSNINTPYSLSDRVILSLYQDSNHVVWIGTYNGVNTFAYSIAKFRSYKFDIQDRSKNLNVVRSLYTTDDVNIYAGTINALSLFNRNDETIQYIKDQDGNQLQNVFSVTSDRQGQLWVGNSNGLQKIQNRNGSYVVEDALAHPELDVFKNSEVSQFVPISAHTYLIATYNENGLYLWDSSKRIIRSFRANSNSVDSLPDNRINHIHVTTKGVVWIATSRGVSRLNVPDYRFTNFQPAGKDPENPAQQMVNAIADDGHVLWLATSGGLIQYDHRSDKSVFFTEEDGLSNNMLYSCLKGHDGTLWMSSNKGISQLDTKTLEFTNYDVSDGLQSNEYNRYAWYRSASGMLYFGGMEGFDVFTSTQIETETRPLAITGVRIIDKNKFAELSPQAHDPKLHHSQNAIGFEYVVLNFDMPRRHNYLCKLEGFDTDWIDNGIHSGISYTNLRPGTYTFRVRVKGDDQASASYSFTILAPYWQTVWFKVFVIVCVAAVLAYVVRQYYSRKMERQRLLFEKQQAVEYERTRIATDMHDDLGAGLSRIKFLSEQIDIKMKMHENAGDDVLKIKAYSNEMISSMGEIVWALNKGNDSVSDLLAYTRAYAAEYLMQNGIDCDIKVTEVIPATFVTGEFRRNVFLAVKEALHNIVKHSSADKVVVNFNVSEKIVITLKDNGKGFQSHSVRPYSNGISNMQKRMRDIGGIMEIKNENGTVVNLIAPLPI